MNQVEFAILRDFRGTLSSSDLFICFSERYALLIEELQTFSSTPTKTLILILRYKELLPKGYPLFAKQQKQIELNGTDQDKLQ